MTIEYIKKYLILFIGLFIMAIGIAFSIKADLGTTPISCVPYVVSLISPISVGTATIIMHCTFIAAQIILLGKKYKPVQLLQFPIALLFGIMTDLALLMLHNITYNSYFEQWLLCILGIVLLALGISLEVLASVITNAGEGVVLAICKVTKVHFGTMKVIFDVSLVSIAAITGFIFKGSLLGIREGTIAAAIFVGIISKIIIGTVTKLRH